MGATLAIVNLADSATLSTTSGAMLRALSQLQVPWARGLARGPSNYVSDSTSLVIRADLGASKNVSAVGIVGLNNSTEVQTGALLMSNTALGNSEVGSYTMQNDALSGATHGNSLWYVAQKAFRYLQIEVAIAYLPSGYRYIDARRLLVMSNGAATGMDATTCTLSDGVDFDWSLTHVDLSTAEETPRGGVFTSPQGTYRRLQFGITGMTSTEAESLRLWIAAARRTAECVVSLREEDTAVLQSNRTIYGRLVDWSPITHTGGDTYACESITVHETPYPALS